MSEARGGKLRESDPCLSLSTLALERLAERGATQDEVVATVEFGERFPAKLGRSGFRRNFSFERIWRGRFYSTKQVEAYAVEEERGWLVITVIVKYF